ncbi:MAG: hypothetical protein KAJ19_13440, partial [Gammaproteobacteria bacterium]|nr:hypothetical protein [Gammaproteobacteria bacterium]
PVIRETAVMYRGRELLVALDPELGIRIKEKGRRVWYDLDVLTAYETAIRIFANEEARKR